MSYCRFSEGDAYIFEHVDGFFVCCACRLEKGFLVDKNYKTRLGMIKHIRKHIEAGHSVPQEALDRLLEEYHDDCEYKSKRRKAFRRLVNKSRKQL